MVLIHYLTPEQVLFLHSRLISVIGGGHGVGDVGMLVTIGAKTGLLRRIEIWFTNLDGRIIICGTPDAKGGKGHYRPRDWLANLRAHPDFTFCLKESLKIDCQQ